MAIELIETTHTLRMSSAESKSLFHGLQTIRLFDNEPELTNDDLSAHDKKILIEMMNLLRKEFER